MTQADLGLSLRPRFMAIDTNKLHAILTAAQNPAFKKLMDERTKKLEERAKIDGEIAEIDEKIATTIPPELLALLTPPQPAGAMKVRKRKASAEEAPAEPVVAPDPVTAEAKPQETAEPAAA